MYNWNKTIQNSEFTGISFLHFTFSKKKKHTQKKITDFSKASYYSGINVD